MSNKVFIATVFFEHALYASVSQLRCMPSWRGASLRTATKKILIIFNAVY